MKSILNTTGAAVSLFVAFSSSAFAIFDPLPEPSSVGLTGLGLGLAVYFLRKSKKK